MACLKKDIGYRRSIPNINANVFQHTQNSVMVSVAKNKNIKNKLCTFR